MDMTFNKNLILILCVASCVVVCPAQDKKSTARIRPDLTGTWERNPSRSKNSSGGPLGPAIVTLIISHKDPELKIARKDVVKDKETITDSVFYTDGRGEKNVALFSTLVSFGSIPSPDQSAPRRPDISSKTKWEGNKVVSRSSVHFTVLGKRYDRDVTETRELSPDGKILTIVITFFPARSTRTEVFDRVQ